MAKIQTDQEQINALDEVNKKLDVIQAINELVFQSEGDFRISGIRAGEKKGGKKKVDDVVFSVGSGEGVKLTKILIQYKHSLIKEIDKLTKQYRLVLDDEELASFSDEPEPELDSETLLEENQEHQEDSLPEVSLPELEECIDPAG